MCSVYKLNEEEKLVYQSALDKGFFENPKQEKLQEIAKSTGRSRDKIGTLLGSAVYKTLMGLDISLKRPIVVE